MAKETSLSNHRCNKHVHYVDTASRCCHCFVVELVDMWYFSARDGETMTSYAHYQTENNEG